MKVRDLLKKATKLKKENKVEEAIKVLDEAYKNGIYEPPSYEMEEDEEYTDFDKLLTLQDLDENKEITYHLVSSEESDVSKGMISTVSPIGKSLMGHEEGDEVTIHTPRGIKNYEITKLKTLHN